MKIVVAGAGVAGLAFAAFMAQLAPQVSVVVLEREAAPAPAHDQAVDLHRGGAVPLLRSLGVLDPVLNAAVAMDGQLLLDPRGKILLRRDHPIRRADLGGVKRALAAIAGPVHFGVSVRGYGQFGDRMRATLAAGDAEEADWIVGADGANSSLRHQMIGDRRVYRGLSAIVGHAPISIDHPRLRLGAFMTLGREGNSVRVVRQPRGVQLSFIERFSEPRTFSNAEIMLRRLRSATSRWHDPVPEIVAALDASMLEFRDWFDRPLTPRLRDGQVWLIGEAAHSTPPFQWDSADLAITDAYHLARFFAASAVDADSVAAEMLDRGARAIAAARDTALQLHTPSRIERSIRHLTLRTAYLVSSVLRGR